VPQFNPAQLAAWTAGHWTVEPTAALTGFGIDSRKIEAGQLFVALKTGERDGHDFLSSAKAAGASGAVVQEVRASVDLPQLLVADSLVALQTIALKHRQEFTGPVTGISGSAGKTSTKDLLGRLLGSKALVTEGNLNNHLGVPLTLTRLDAEKHEFAIIEAGISAPGEMAPLARMIDPDVTIITLIDHAHTKELGGLDGVAKEKSVLPHAVRSDGLTVLPRRVADLRPFTDLPGRRLVVERADVLMPDAQVADTIYFTVTHRGSESAVTVAYGNAPETYVFRRVSEGMTQNAVLAICVARWLGVAPVKIRERMIGWGPAPLRGEVREEAGRLVYLDCYNANPAAMVDALQVFDEMTTDGAARLFLLGGMEELGEVCEAKHREVGQALKLRKADRVLLIGTGADSVRFGALEGGAEDEQIEVLRTLTGVETRIAEWRGPVFVKGSRCYRLETVVPTLTGGLN